MVHWLFIALLAPAWANQPAPTHGDPAHGAPPAHGTPVEGEVERGTHASDAEQAHEGGGGAHHVTYSDDEDHDGVPNWRDPTNAAAPNEDSYVASSIGWHVLNFSLLVGALVYFLRKPLMDTFRERSTTVRHELTDSARARDEAHQRHQELLARLDRIENEVRVMEQEAEVDAQREEQKLIERANREAARIAEQAERNIRDETSRARQELRQEAVELAVKLAESTLRKGVNTADQQTLAREFLRSVKGVGSV